MKQIKLTQGKVTLVDDEDFDYLNNHKWYFNGYYAARDIGASPNKQHIYMHRLILGTKKGENSDHINGDKLDNRKSNLRVATKAQNSMNVKKRTDNTSGFKGVSWMKRERKWRARIFKNGKETHLGTFDNPREAALAYNQAAQKYYKEFSILNQL